MFTGLIEDIGTVARVSVGPRLTKLEISTSLDVTNISVGASVAIDGVCLTVTSPPAQNTLCFDVGSESARVTKLGKLKVNERVHVERAMLANGRLDGHIVTGHVDGVGTIVRRTMNGATLELRVQPPSALLHQCVKKGSIAIDGVSLTVNDVDETAVDVALVPHTLAKTTLAHRSVGDTVHLETDILGKYVERLLERRRDPLTWDKLRDAGFLDRE